MYCNKSMSLITADFEPAVIKGVSGVYATLCRVIPNITGVFQITLINFNETAVQLHNRKHLGVLLTSNETICTADSVEDDNASHIANNIIHGDLSEGNRTSLLSLISKYQSIFAANPKKPTLVKNLEHRIITDNALPVS